MQRMQASSASKALWSKESPSQLQWSFMCDTARQAEAELRSLEYKWQQYSLWIQMLPHTELLRRNMQVSMWEAKLVY